MKSNKIRFVTDNLDMKKQDATVKRHPKNSSFVKGKRDSSPSKGDASKHIKDLTKKKLKRLSHAESKPEKNMGPSSNTRKGRKSQW